MKKSTANRKEEMTSTQPEPISHYSAPDLTVFEITPPPCGLLSDREGGCLVLAFRHLGDAVIAASWIRGLQRYNPLLKIDVLGRPELREILMASGAVAAYHSINLPLFGHHRRDLRSILGAAAYIRRLRRNRYTFCINLIGDTRENLIGLLIGPKWNIAPNWSPGHLFKAKMTDRGAAGLANSGIEIPPRFENYYDSLDYFGQRLGLQPIQWSLSESSFRGKARQNGILRIALHPGASHPSRHWPTARWKELMRHLDRRGCRMQLLGSTREEQDLREAYRLEIEELQIEVVTDTMPVFFTALADADLLVGMDSLSAHAAFFLGVPSVVMNGSSDHRIMTPPGSVALSAGHLCNCFPCNYAYPCRKQEKPYICCQGIEVSEVLKAVDDIARGDRPAPVPIKFAQAGGSSPSSQAGLRSSGCGR